MDEYASITGPSDGYVGDIVTFTITYESNTPLSVQFDGGTAIVLPSGEGSPTITHIFNDPGEHTIFVFNEDGTINETETFVMRGRPSFDLSLPPDRFLGTIVAVKLTGNNMLSVPVNYTITLNGEEISNSTIQTNDGEADIPIPVNSPGVYLISASYEVASDQISFVIEYPISVTSSGEYAAGDLVKFDVELHGLPSGSHTVLANGQTIDVNENGAFTVQTQRGDEIVEGVASITIAGTTYEDSAEINLIPITLSITPDKNYYFEGEIAILKLLATGPIGRYYRVTPPIPNIHGDTPEIDLIPGVPYYYIVNAHASEQPLVFQMIGTLLVEDDEEVDITITEEVNLNVLCGPSLTKVASEELVRYGDSIEYSVTLSAPSGSYPFIDEIAPYITTIGGGETVRYWYSPPKESRFINVARVGDLTAFSQVNVFWFEKTADRDEYEIGDTVNYRVEIGGYNTQFFFSDPMYGEDPILVSTGDVIEYSVEVNEIGSLTNTATLSKGGREWTASVTVSVTEPRLKWRLDDCCLILYTNDYDEAEYEWETKGLCEDWRGYDCLLDNEMKICRPMNHLWDFYRVKIIMNGEEYVTQALQIKFVADSNDDISPCSKHCKSCDCD